MNVTFRRNKMEKIPKLKYTTEFKEQAVNLVKDGKSIGSVIKGISYNKLI